jgi:hypothetical protein
VRFAVIPGLAKTLQLSGKLLHQYGERLAAGAIDEACG